LKALSVAYHGCVLAQEDRQFVYTEDVGRQ
jgi:formate dehydrogenase assembly factor FdhD